MPKEKPIHEDILGQPLEEGNYIAVSRHNSLQICQVIKLSPKKLRARPVQKSNYYYGEGHLVYSSETLKLTGEDAIAYILKYAG